MAQSNPVRAEVHDTEDNRQREPPRADRARVEDDNASITTNERHVRVPTHHHGCVLRARQTSSVCAQAWAIDANVYHHDAESLRPRRIDLQHQHVGKRRAPAVDVASHGKHRGHRSERLHHAEITDISGVHDGVWAKRADRLECSGVGFRMRVSQQDQPKGSVTAGIQMTLEPRNRPGSTGGGRLEQVANLAQEPTMRSQAWAALLLASPALTDRCHTRAAEMGAA